MMRIGMNVICGSFLCTNTTNKKGQFLAEHHNGKFP